MTILFRVTYSNLAQIFPALCRLEWVNERAFFLQIRSQPELYPGCEGDKSWPISGTSVSHSRRGHKEGAPRIPLWQATEAHRRGVLAPVLGLYRKTRVGVGKRAVKQRRSYLHDRNFPLNFARIAGNSSFSEKNDHLPNEQNLPTRICVEPFFP